MAEQTTTSQRSLFRPCIDLHDGKVKQIVGGSLTDDGKELQTNFVASQSPSHFATLYRKNNLTGGHVIKLGPNNDASAEEALAAWPGGLQIGGGITVDNAKDWLSKGASKVIVTSWLFPSGEFSMERLREISALVGPQHLVVDLSCRRKGISWNVAINRWQTITDMEVNRQNLERLSKYASEFLVHAADVENKCHNGSLLIFYANIDSRLVGAVVRSLPSNRKGLCHGIDGDLVKALGAWSPVPCTYAGGARDINDLSLVNQLSNGRVDLTIGSALDIFGGRGVKYSDCVAWNNRAS